MVCRRGADLCRRRIAQTVGEEYGNYFTRKAVGCRRKLLSRLPEISLCPAVSGLPFPSVLCVGCPFGESDSQDDMDLGCRAVAGARRCGLHLGFYVPFFGTSGSGFQLASLAFLPFGAFCHPKRGFGCNKTQTYLLACIPFDLFDLFYNI